MLYTHTSSSSIYAIMQYVYYAKIQATKILQKETNKTKLLVLENIKICKKCFDVWNLNLSSSEVM